MRKIVIILFLFALASFIQKSIRVGYSQSTTPPAASTGAPGETNCSSCHASSDFDALLTLAVDDGIDQYIPGHTYLIDLDIQTSLNSPKHLYGFEITARNQANNVVGEWIASNPNTIILDQGKYLSHYNSTSIPQDGHFLLEWTAPETGQGAISFYASAVAGNHDNTATGDAVANALEIITQDPNTHAQKDYFVSIKVFLEGLYDETLGEMKTDLRDNKLLPLDQPFNVHPYNFDEEISVQKIPGGVVDWVLIEARNGIPNLIFPGTENLEVHLGFLMKDGSIKALDGISPIIFTKLQPDCYYYFAVRHRTHLDIFTADPTSTFYDLMAYDFTTGLDKAFGTSQMKRLPDGKYAMISGDYDGNGVINSGDYNSWRQQNALIFEYVPWDGDGNGIVNNLDYNHWYQNRGKICCSEVQY